MRATVPLIASAMMICGVTGALAQFGGNGGNTTRPSYDNPRAYDRDARGNETYQYYSSPDEMQRARHHAKKKKKHRKHRHYD
jgi:hypothetical protein